MSDFEKEQLRHNRELEKRAATTARAAKATAIAASVSAIANIKQAQAAELANQAAQRSASANELAAAATIQKNEFERDVLWLDRSNDLDKLEFYLAKIGYEEISSLFDSCIERAIRSLNLPNDLRAAIGKVDITHRKYDSTDSLYNVAVDRRRVLYSLPSLSNREAGRLLLELRRNGEDPEYLKLAKAIVRLRQLGALEVDQYSGDSIQFSLDDGSLRRAKLLGAILGFILLVAFPFNLGFFAYDSFGGQTTVVYSAVALGLCIGLLVLYKCLSAPSDWATVFTRNSDILSSSSVTTNSLKQRLSEDAEIYREALNEAAAHLSIFAEIQYQSVSPVIRADFVMRLKDKVKVVESEYPRSSRITEFPADEELLNCALLQKDDKSVTIVEFARNVLGLMKVPKNIRNEIIGLI